MTFEEFFAKKKIDLVQLEKAEPLLYNEFKSHFSAMGEKSFDHTKKFWFNKLRRLYHLTPADKAITQVDTAIASQAEPLSSPTIEQKPAPVKSTEEQTAQNPVAKPAFKPRNIPAREQEPKADEAQTEQKPVAKPAFKPRNIPSKAPEPNVAEETASEPEPKPVAKPAFKPRNIPVKPQEEKTEEGKSETPSTDAPTPTVKAPGFRPRNIKSLADENAVDSNRADSRPGQPEISETPITNPGKLEEAAKEGYKPKFKLKNIPRSPGGGEEQSGHPVRQELMPDSLPGIQTEKPTESDIERRISSSTEEKTLEQKIQDNDQSPRGIDTSEQEKPKPAYKPKFNLKNIKPKPGDDKNL